MIARLLAALAVLSGARVDIPRRDALRIARSAGFHRARGASSGNVRRALNLAGIPAFNEYRVPFAPSFGGDRIHDPEGDALAYRQNRNAAKARRRALRAS